MGVTYKLTDDVVAFILEQKRQGPDFSCRELVELVAAHFKRDVSKSSVHEVLKEAGIASPRGRKHKFHIPDEKKAQLIAGLPPAVLAAIAAVPVIPAGPPSAAAEPASGQDDRLKGALPQGPGEINREERAVSLQEKAQEGPPPMIQVNAGEASRPTTQENALQEPPAALNGHAADGQQPAPRENAGEDPQPQLGENAGQERAPDPGESAGEKAAEERGDDALANGGCGGEPLKLRVQPMIPDPPEVPAASQQPCAPSLPALEETADSADAREFFLQAAFYDLFPGNGGPVKAPADLNGLDPDTLRKEQLYRAARAACFRVEMQDGRAFHLDARFQALAREEVLPCRLMPAESALRMMADTLHNNIRPLVIRRLAGEYLDAAAADLFASMQNSPGKQLSCLRVLDERMEEMAAFTPLPRIKRTFIAGVPVGNKDMAPLLLAPPPDVQAVNAYFTPGPCRFYVRRMAQGGIELRAIIVVSQTSQPVIVLLSNAGAEHSAGGIVAAYLQAHPLSGLCPAAQGNEEHGPAGDMISDHARYLFGNIFSENSREHWAGLRARNQQGAGINLLTISNTACYEYFPGLEQAISIINNIGILDHLGRKFWVSAG